LFNDKIRSCFVKRVVLASNNPGKVREFSALLREFGIEVLPQSVFGVPEAVEDGLTFVENAIIKARNACEHTGTGGRFGY
jgi:XTP/dITP diphosphohydrolase